MCITKRAGALFVRRCHIRRGLLGRRACRGSTQSPNPPTPFNPGEGLPSPFPSHRPGPAGCSWPATPYPPPLLSHVPANIQYFTSWSFQEIQRNHNFCSTSLLKRTLLISGKSLRSYRSQKTMQCWKGELVQKQLGFTSYLMSQGFNFHLRKPTFQRHCITHLWRCQFRNHQKPSIFTIHSPHWFAKSMPQKRQKIIKND